MHREQVDLFERHGCIVSHCSIVASYRITDESGTFFLCVHHDLNLRKQAEREKLTIVDRAA